MAGRVVQIMPRTHYEFSSLPSGAAQLLVAAKDIDVSQYTEAALLVRLHSGQIGSGGNPKAKIEVMLVAVGNTPEDPGQDFVDLTPLATATFEDTTVQGQEPPQFVVADVTSPAKMGSTVAVLVQGTQATGATPIIDVHLSVDLVMKA